LAPCSDASRLKQRRRIPIITEEYVYGLKQSTAACQIRSGERKQPRPLSKRLERAHRTVQARVRGAKIPVKPKRVQKKPPKDVPTEWPKESPTHCTISKMHYQRVRRAKKAYQKAHTNEAKLKLPIAQVERYKFKQKNRITTKDRYPSSGIF
jgi:hypothetical protein